ncbi:MAG TPA: glycosyltransferase family 39 protein, partial [Candidatus Limnocylindrales bacterium]|nr:glycosyltransferase family 39 protein [Candidatus Limnocylindrales bacterium]
MLDRLRTSGGRALLDRLVLAGVLALAAALRFVDLRTRGTWDADQGHDMLELRSLVADGVFPLLGPPTSIGDFHHGALYYYLLAPAAALTGADPFWVVAEIALAGVAAVGITWWLARSIGGPIAGAVAGLLMAVSASAIDESTFIWNPNLVALSSSIALAGAWQAWSTRRARWWLLAAVGVIVTMHCHVLGVVLLPPVAVLAILDARRRDPGPERRRVAMALLGGAGLLAASYIPLLVHELDSNGSELR